MTTFYKSTTAGNWSAAASWDLHDNHAGGDGPPTNGDDVIFNGNSAACTIDTTTCVCKTAVFTGYTGTLTHTDGMKLTVSGNLTMVAGMTYTLESATTSALTIDATAELNTGGKTIGNFIYNKTGGTLTLMADVTCSGSWTNTAGALAGNFAVILTGATPTITPTAAFSFYNLTRTGNPVKTDTLVLAGNITVTNALSLNGNSSVNRVFVSSNTIGTARTITCGNTKTLTNVDLRDITWGSTNSRTISSAASDGATGTRFLTAAAHGLIAGDLVVIAGTTHYDGAIAVLNVSDSTHFDIATAYVDSHAGTWTLDLSAITGGSGNAGGNTGFTFTTAKSLYWRHGGTASKSWSDSYRWADSPESLGDEVLTNGALTSGTSWSRTNDAALTGDAAVYTYSAGTYSYIRQANATLALTPVANAIYKLTYTISSVSGTPAAFVNAGAFAEASTYLNITAGTHSTYFIGHATPTAANFDIGSTLTAGQAFTLDDLSVKQVALGRVSLPQDTAYFDAGSFANASAVVTQDMPRIGSVDWTGAMNTPTWTTSTTASCFGSITLITATTGMVLTGSTHTYTMEGRGSYTLTSAGNTWAKDIHCYAPGGALSILDALTTSGMTLAVRSGTVSTNGNTITAGFINGAWEITRNFDFTNSLLVATGTTGTPFNMNGMTSITSTGSTVKLTGSSATTKTFNGGGKTFNNVWFAPGSGTGEYDILGSNTFADFKDDGTAAHSVKFSKSTTTTVASWNVGTASARGANTNVITLDTVDGAGTFALTKTGGGGLVCTSLNIQRSVAGGAGALWWAGPAPPSTNNNGAGSGWLFTAPPQVLLYGIGGY